MITIRKPKESIGNYEGPETLNRNGARTPFLQHRRRSSDAVRLNWQTRAFLSGFGTVVLVVPSKTLEPESYRQVSCTQNPEPSTLNPKP